MGCAKAKRAQEGVVPERIADSHFTAKTMFDDAHVRPNYRCNRKDFSGAVQIGFLVLNGGREQLAKLLGAVASGPRKEPSK